MVAKVVMKVRWKRYFEEETVINLIWGRGKLLSWGTKITIHKISPDFLLLVTER